MFIFKIFKKETQSDIVFLSYEDKALKHIDNIRSTINKYNMKLSTTIKDLEFLEEIIIDNQKK